MLKASESKASPHLFLSNKVELLSDHLQSLLFAEGGQPFQRRLVVVPNDRIKSFLTRRFAQKMTIAAGFQCTTLTQAVSELLDSSDKKLKVPTLLELSFLLEDAIRSLSHKRQDFAKEDLESLFRYLEAGSQRGSSMSRFCQELSSHFFQSSLYGNIEKLPAWQQILWNEVFSQTSWSEPHKALSEEFFLDMQVHLFGFSYLPKRYIHFFKQLRADYYLLSPCSYFWEDLCSDKERVRIHRFFRKVSEKKHQELDSYLNDGHPLLANLGKLGRQFLKLLDDEEFIVSDQYEEVGMANISFLHTVQNALLQQGNPEEKISIPFDHSIQLHTAASKLREVEALFNTLLSIFVKDSSLSLKDVVVFAPDIAEFASYIHAVFGSRESPFSYAIYDLPVASQSHLAQGMLQLEEICQRRFETSSLLKLITNPLFQAKMQLSQADVNLWRRWIEEANILWGASKEHRQSVLSNKELGSCSTTWEAGLDRLLFGLAMLEQEDCALSVAPIPSVEFSESELLGKLIEVIYSLKEDLKPIYQNKVLKLSTWASYFKSLAESYFTIAPEDSGYLQNWCRLALSLKELGNFDFDGARRILQDSFEKSGAIFKISNTESITFCSLDKGSISSYKIVCILGMEEGSFPRLEQKRFFGQTCFKNEYIPSSSDEDRQAFLEVILSAREFLIMSYSKLSAKDHKEQEPSLVLKEFIEYLDAAYCLDELKPSMAIKTIHPTLPFDKSYFVKDSSLKSHSKTQFLAARAHYEMKGKKNHYFFGEFFEKSKSEKKTSSQEMLVDLKHLFRLAKNPLQFYFNQALGIYLDREKIQDEFLMSSLESYILRKKARLSSVSQVLSSAEKQGRLPAGLFKEVASERFAKRVQEELGELKQFHISTSDLFTIELKTSCDAPYVTDTGDLFLPALKVPLKSGKEAILLGKLEGVTLQGLFCEGAGNTKDLIKNWPQFLLYLSLSFENKGPQQMLFAKSGKVYQSPLLDPLEHLKNYLEYYEKALEHPSPLLPDWAVPLLEKDPERLQKAIQASCFSGMFVDPYLEWLSVRDPLPSALMLIENWSSYLLTIFAPLLKTEETE